MKTALVTGATSGIGRAIALELAQADYRVIAAGRSQGALAGIASDRITPLALDVMDRAAVVAALEGLSIDVLVNNAGMMPPLGNFADADMDDIDRAIGVNLTAVLALTRLVVPQMRQRGSGHVLFTGSARHMLRSRTWRPIPRRKRGFPALRRRCGRIWPHTASA